MKRRTVLTGAGATVAGISGLLYLGGGSAAATSNGTYEIDGDPEVATADGDVSYVALVDAEAEVTWQNFADDIEYVQQYKNVTIEEGGETIVEADQVVGTDVVEVESSGGGGDSSGEDGYWKLNEDGESDSVTIVEAADYESEFGEPPIHDPIDGDEVSVADEADGETREFTITVEVVFDLYYNETDEEPVDNAVASDDFTLTVSNEEADTDASGESTADAE